MVKQRFLSVTVYACMIIIWLCLIGMVLYSPIITQFFERKKTLTVFTWTDMVDPEILHAFKERTGIEVRLRYFENNEELFIKLLAGRGEGFDLIIPSDYVMEKLIEHKLVKKLDRAKLNFWDQLNPNLLGTYFDPSNSYSIPYHWAVYGLGINTEKIHAKDITWKLLFDPQAPGKVAMLNTPREAISLTAYYLYHSLNELSKQQEIEVAQQLREQRKRVEAYMDGDSRADYLLKSRQCDVAIVASSFIAHTLKTNPSIEFKIPQEGSFLVIDSLVISSQTDNEKSAYEFINFLFEPVVLKHHFNKYTFCPAVNEFYQWLDEAGAPSMLIDAYNLKKNTFHFFKQVLPDHSLNELWMSIKL